MTNLDCPLTVKSLCFLGPAGNTNTFEPNFNVETISARVEGFYVKEFEVASTFTQKIVFAAIDTTY